MFSGAVGSSSCGAAGRLLGVLSRNMSSSSQKRLRVEELSKGILDAQYAVRGELVIKATEMEKQGKRIVYCNIGNPQQLQQKPITFFRQVLAMTNYPELMKSGEAVGIPRDAVERAREYLDQIPGGTGAYSHSMGVPIVRKEVAEFIRKRDGGIPSNPEDIFLTDGASPGIQRALQMLIDPLADKKSGILIPIPQYPLYSSAITLLGGVQLRYELDESKEWALDISSMEKTVEDAHKSGTVPKAIVVINPGNPTGQCMSRANIEEVVTFAERHNLVLLADEVYQTNTYRADRPFVSFKKVVSEMKSPVELFSFHSTSKGMLGECGRRGGYYECVNVDAAVKEQMYKLASISLCSNLDGQIMTGLMVNPPAEGEPSYELYRKEYDALFASLARRAKKISTLLNNLEGFTCNNAEGAMYVFPQLSLPAKAIEAAKAAGKVPDAFYCLRLLDETGICVVPGSGFGQKDGTWHFRITILPQEDVIDAVVEKISSFHKKFMDQYR